MDIYVVLHFKGNRATVIGASADHGGAVVIADRHAHGLWKPWDHQESLGRDIRSADMTNEDQTITRVPLAGAIRSDERRSELSRMPIYCHSEIEEIGRTFGAP